MAKNSISINNSELFHALSILGIEKLEQIKSEDPKLLYEKLCRKTEIKYDYSIVNQFAIVIDNIKNNPYQLEEIKNSWYKYKNPWK